MGYRPPGGRFAGVGIGGGSVPYRLCWKTIGINGTQNYEAKMDEKCPWAFFMGRALPMNPLCLRTAGMSRPWETVERKTLGTNVPARPPDTLHLNSAKRGRDYIEKDEKPSQAGVFPVPGPCDVRGTAPDAGFCGGGARAQLRGVDL